jgi:GMP synthase-like glutamine amidotransferase
VRALVIEHDPLSTPERVGEHLERRGIALDPFVVVEDGSDPKVTTVFPDTGHDLVVLMGSPWSVYDPRARGWVAPELDFIGRLAKAGVPMLGICFGAQAMAASLGGSVAPSARPEYGWGGVGSLVGPIAEGPWFQFHHDEISPPGAAVELARNASGTQAFRLGRGLGVQFHPEMTARLLASWYPAGAADALVEVGVDPDRLLEESEARAVESQPALERMLDWFLDEVVGNAGADHTVSGVG